MHVLILGGTGLISTSIARKLLERGERVTCYNRGRSENRLPAHPNLDILLGDRSDRAAFEATFSGKTYDAVIDMIAYHLDDAESDLRAFAGRCGQFVFCSTVCVYSGPPETIPTPETEPYHSIGQYGKNKAAIEERFLAEHARNGFPATILRPSHSYGEGGSLIRPWGSWGSFGTFVDRVRKGKPLIIPGDGTNLWASCHVDDVAAGFIATLGKPACLGQCYNITGDEWVTWNDYHAQVADVVGGTFQPVYIPTDLLGAICPPDWTAGLREIFAHPSVFVNDKIKAAGYPGQTISWREGVRRTVAWMEANGKLADADRDGTEDAIIAAWQKAIGAIPRPVV